MSVDAGRLGPAARSRRLQPVKDDDEYRPLSGRRRLLLLLLGVATAAAIVLSLLAPPGGAKGPRPPPPPEPAPCAPGQTSVCLGGKADVIVAPASAPR